MKNIQHVLLPLLLYFWLMPAAQAELYHLTDLGGGHAFDINDAGQVVGAFGTQDYIHAFLWTRSTGMQDLGDLPGGDDWSIARRINDAGQVVGFGFAEDLSNGQAGSRRAFLWTSNGGMQDLGVVPGAGHYQSEAFGINDTGQVVGNSSGSKSSDNGPFLWTAGGGMQTLAGRPLNTGGSAFGINNAGQVVGQADGLAYVWGSTDGWQTLGLLPGQIYSAANAINNVGQVVGYSYDPPVGSRAFLWTKTEGMQDLGDLPGGGENVSSLEPYDINDPGQVVGRASGQNYLRAFLWSSTNGMQDLNTLLDGSGAGWIVDEATAINNAGQIVGGGLTPAGQYHAFLLTPVPEPTTLPLFISGAAMLAIWRRRPGPCRAWN